MQKSVIITHAKNRKPAVDKRVIAYDAKKDKWVSDYLDKLSHTEIPQVIVMCDDEPPENGDMVLASDGQIWEFMQTPCPLPYWGNKGKCKRIVASYPPLRENSSTISASMIQELIVTYFRRSDATTFQVSDIF